MSLEGTSKFLSLILRHQPETIGLTLDEHGWAEVNELVRLSNLGGRKLTRELIDEVVESSNKKRFVFSDDGTKIRANQGHSTNVDLGLRAAIPPEVLFHGTATRFLDSIVEKGLVPGSRQHVHLSFDFETAVEVGRRHGKPAVLTVRSMTMHNS